MVPRKPAFQKKRRRWPWVIVLILCALLVAWLYHRNQAVTFTNDAPVRVEVKREQPDIYVGAASAQFSIYAPQYPGSTVIEASRMADANGMMMMASMTTPDSVEKVSDYYRNALDEKGFAPKATIEGDRLQRKATIAGNRPSAGLSVLISIQSIPNNGTRIDLTDTTQNVDAGQSFDPIRNSNIQSY